MPRKSVNQKSVISKKASTQMITRGNAKPVIAKVTTSKTRRGRGEVRASILSSLNAGPKTAKALTKLGGFSAPSLYVNLKQLKNEKLIVDSGRGGLIRLNNEAAATEPVTRTKSLLPDLRSKPSSNLAVIPQYVSGDLHDALEAVNARFVALDRVGEKLHTLEQLSKTLPSPVAKVLMSIHRDLMNLSPARVES